MKSPLDHILSTDEAARLLGVSMERVAQFGREGRIRGKKLSREWVWDKASVEQFARVARPPGPRKNP